MSNKLPDVTEQEWQQIDSFNQDIVAEFLEQGQLSPDTINQYKSALRQFFKWVYDNAKNKPLHELKPRDALRYQNFLLARELSSSAIRFKRSAVSSLCNYVEMYYLDEYPTFRNICKGLPSIPKTRTHEKQPLTPDEYKNLIDTLEKNKDWQILAWVKVAYKTGCRRSESRQLLKEVTTYTKHIDKKGNQKNFYFTHEVRAKGRGKAGKPRKFKLDEDTMQAINKWLQIRGEDDCPYVFVNKNKQQLSKEGFNYWCEEILSKIVGRRVHPHIFRSTRATHLKEYEGYDIKKIQKLLGHESSTTTEIYIVQEEDEDDDIFD